MHFRLTQAPIETLFRAYCFQQSRAIFRHDGKLSALRRLLAEIPCRFL